MTSITDKLRSRFRPDRSSTPPTVEDKEDDRKSTHSDDDGSSRENSEEIEEKKVYELQLSQLQEQLVAAVIENQALDAEVKSLRDGSGVAELRDELESERAKNKALQDNLEYAQKSQIRGIVTREIQDWVDVASEASEETPALICGHPSAKRHGLIDRFNNWLVSMYFEILADLTEDAEPIETQDKEGDQLTVKKLKENIKRFKKDAKPIGGTAKGIHSVMTWKNPALTFITFVVYMYSVWYGWLLPVVLFVMILKLSINYLRHRGLNINLVLLADEEDEEKESDAFKELGMSAKFDLVVQVARKVQNAVGQLADNLEKLKNLLMWEQPTVTRRLYVMLCVMFLLTCILPGATLFTLLALLFGVRMFIIQYIYTKFPRIKQKHDGTQRMWRSLPTDAEKEELYQRAAIDRCVLPESGDNRSSGSQRSARKKAVSEKDIEFAEMFQLPTSELPLKGWKGGKRCTLIDREKSLRHSFKTGKLYLTHSFLCFERHKSLTHAQMNIVLPLTDILKIAKAKPYSWVPGEGMSIAVTVVGQSKPYTFGAILNRDEVFENIVIHGVNLNLPWVVEHKQNVDEGNEKENDGGSVDQLSGSTEASVEKDQFSPDSQNLFL